MLQSPYAASGKWSLPIRPTPAPTLPVVAGPGQAVVARPDEKHRVSCAGDVPAVYYLTVTPHQSPTHTHYDHQGNRQPTTPGVTHPTWKGELAMGVTR